MTTTSPLTPNEAALLRAAEPGAWLEVAEAAAAAGLRPDQAQPGAEALVMRGLFERREEVTSRLVLGPAGREQADGGLPELRIRARLAGGPLAVNEAQDVAGLTKAAVGSAFGGLKKAGLVRVEGGRAALAEEGAGWAALDAVQALLRRVAAAPDGLAWEEVDPALVADVEARLPSKRGRKDDAVFERQDARRRRYRLTDAGEAARAELAEAAPEVAQLTPELLKDGAWRRVRFRRFHVGDPPQVVVGRRNAYRAFLDRVKLKLLALGFEEMRASLVESEFWNMDALFLPQFHPARDIQDVYFVEEPGSGGFSHADEVEGGALEAVAREHEGRGPSGSRGWGYEFDRQRTRRLVLRSQGTALSARWLARARVPGKYFGMARCFRYDTVDATHAPDFFQVEGIVVSPRATLRSLMGLLELFARELARSREVKFVPAYFPFTEPSVEVHMRHPDLGWIELGGAGIFRPEVTRPHGLDVPVIAWGLGLDRMAMVALGISDIRHLFTNNIPEGLSGLRR